MTQASNRWTMIAYALAIIGGIANGLWGMESLLALADFVSSIFIRLFKFISVPIIAVSIIATLSQISQSRDSGRIFSRTIFYTIFTTVLSATVASLLYVLIASSADAKYLPSPQTCVFQPLSTMLQSAS